jgi:hypothetical protein
MVEKLRALVPNEPVEAGQPASTPAAANPGAPEPGAGDAPAIPPLVLLFIKHDDTHSVRAIEQLAAQEARHKELYARARFIVVLCRVGTAIETPKLPMPPHWRLLRDEDDAFYAAYKVIATPTVVVVSAADKVVGSHAGYNAGLMRAVQRSLFIELTGEDAPAPVVESASMELQMARRMAERGVWERSLPYFRRAAEQGPLAPGDQLLMARVLVETGEPGEALALLDSMPEGTSSEEAAALRERIAAALPGDKGPANTGTP